MSSSTKQPNDREIEETFIKRIEAMCEDLKESEASYKIEYQNKTYESKGGFVQK
jgi:hypothetical protein